MLDKTNYSRDAMCTFAKKIMKKYFTLFLFLLMGSLAWTQTKNVVTTKINIDVTAIDFANSKQNLKNFVLEKNILIQSQNETKSSVNMDLEMSTEQYQQFVSLLPSLGFIGSNVINTIDHKDEIDALDLEIKFLTQKKKNFEDVMIQHEMKSAQFESLWREKQNIEERIFNLEKQKNNLTTTHLPYSVNITVQEEMTMPDNSRVAFVNMPGVEYSYLKIENPVDTIAASAYQGYFIKYMFTRGKSYAGVGAYKAVQANANDSTYFSELFVMNFGQDFYSRHLGRGQNKFGNLYSGYTVGYIAASNDIRKSDIFYLAPSIGLELFKNKYLLWDTKVNYFIPFSYNRNMRGIGFNTSLNFVF